METLEHVSEQLTLARDPPLRNTAQGSGPQSRPQLSGGLVLQCTCRLVILQTRSLCSALPCTQGADSYESYLPA